jgi:DNA invertase Pin-like site-specific DNA recombinase
MLNQPTPSPTKAIAYYRVSTQKQGASGLGLEAQQAAVADYASRQGLTIIQVFTEVETGTSKKVRAEINKAITAAKAAGAVLLIAKLDRLARNVAFLSNLMETGVNFVACDNPNATPFTLHILAAVAEHEAKIISERTKAALKATKARGTQLGTPENLTESGRKRGHATRRQMAIDGYSDLVMDKITSLRANGLSLGKIAAVLNGYGERTRTGTEFTRKTVQRILGRVESQAA